MNMTNMMNEYDMKMKIRNEKKHRRLKGLVVEHGIEVASTSARGNPDPDDRRRRPDADV